MYVRTVRLIYRCAQTQRASKQRQKARHNSNFTAAALPCGIMLRVALELTPDNMWHSFTCHQKARVAAAPQLACLLGLRAGAGQPWAAEGLSATRRQRRDGVGDRSLATRTVLSLLPKATPPTRGMLNVPSTATAHVRRAGAQRLLCGAPRPTTFAADTLCAENVSAEAERRLAGRTRCCRRRWASPASHRGSLVLSCCCL
jgi:hypothetical protein